MHLSACATRQRLFLVVLASALSGCGSAPSAIAGPTPVAILDAPERVAWGESVELSGRASFNPAGYQLAFVWTLEELPERSFARLDSTRGPLVRFTADHPGEYRVQLVVWAEGRHSAPAEVRVTALGAPVAEAGDDTVAAVGSVVRLDGSASYEASALDTLTFAWRFVSRPQSSAAVIAGANAEQASFVLDLSGDYVIELVTGDATRQSEPDTVAVRAYDRPVADAGPDFSVGRGALVELQARDYTYEYGSYCDWSFISRPEGSAAYFSSYSSGGAAEFTADVAGSYVLGLEVHGPYESAQDTLTIEAVQYPPLSDVLDPAEVYLLGTREEGLCGAEVVTLVRAPDSYVAGFDCDASPDILGLRPTDGALLYASWSDPLLRVFHADGGPAWLPGDPYPAAPLSNDLLLPTSPCGTTVGTEIFAVLTAPDGAVLHRCYSGSYTNTWYDESGNLAYSGARELLHLGFARTALADGAIVSLDGLAETPITGLPGDTLYTIRAREDGFWVVAPGSTLTMSNAELWLVALDGSATLVGGYPPWPDDFRLRWEESGALDGAGRFFQMGESAGDWPWDTVCVRGLDGTSEVIYSEALSPTVRIHMSSLFTGP